MASYIKISVDRVLSLMGTNKLPCPSINSSMVSILYILEIYYTGKYRQGT